MFKLKIQKEGLAFLRITVIQAIHSQYYQFSRQETTLH